MTKKLLSFLLFVVIASQIAMAQTRVVRGKVVDSDGVGVPGATVLIKGTTNGTVTDADGNYQIEVTDGAVLVYQAMGLTTQEVAVGAQSILDVSMELDEKQLKEIVVIGYGTQERKDLTGSVSKIQGADLANLVTPSFDQQLAGRAAGVQVTVPSGLLGQAPTIRVRGTNSISGSASPLIVIDGVPMLTGDATRAGSNQANALADLNPSDIESFEVLKDGSATAIYGSRAANGVILITTKRGKTGKARVTYDAWIGWSEAAKRFDLLNASEFVTINNEKAVSAGIATPQFFESGYDTKWQDYVFRTGFQHNQTLSVSGANANTSYFFSVGYTDQQSFVVANEQSRASFRANLDHKVSNWLSVGTNMSVAYTRNSGLNTGRNNLSGNVLAATRMYPNVPVYDEANPLGYNIAITSTNPLIGARLGRGVNLRDIDDNYPNIRYILDKNINQTAIYRLIGNVYAEVNIPSIEGLKFRTQYAVDGLIPNEFVFLDPYHGDGQSSRGIVQRSNSSVLLWNWQNTIQYNKVFGDHKLGLVAGTEYQYVESYGFTAQGANITGPFFGQTTLITGTVVTPTVTGTGTRSGFDSYFARANYSFQDKYLISASIRNDGISKLPSSNRRATFYGVSLGWRISNESFFNLSFINDLKLRGSYAIVGNDNIAGGNFPYAGTLGATLYGLNGAVSYTIYGNAGNDALRWETSAKLNAGFDASFLDNRINLTFDWYQNDTRDLVLSAPTPPSLGIPGNIINKNVGKMRNSGIELSITSENIKTDNFSWSTSFNFSTNQNKILALNEGQDIVNPYSINREGYSIGSLYGYDFLGVNAANGNPVYRRADGVEVQGNIANNTYYVYNSANPTDLSQVSSLSANDRVILGNTLPTWFGGLSNTVTYKGFDFSLFLRFSGGNKIMNVTRESLLNMGYYNNGREIMNRWTTPGQITDVPRIRYGNGNFINLAGSTNSRFVEDGSFLRIQSISLGYTLPQNLVSRFGISKLRVYAQGQNLWVFTKYKGLDPEINANPNSNDQLGIDFNGNPQQRIWTMGINVTF